MCSITYLVSIPALNDLPVGQNISADTWPPVTSFPRETDGRGWSPEVLLERFYISPLGGVLTLPLSTHVSPHVRFTSDQGAQQQIFKAPSNTVLPKMGRWAMPAAVTNRLSPTDGTWRGQRRRHLPNRDGFPYLDMNGQAEQCSSSPSISRVPIVFARAFVP